jgi:hypothetical protein
MGARLANQLLLHNVARAPILSRTVRIGGQSVSFTGTGFNGCGKTRNRASTVSGNDFTGCEKLEIEPALYQGTTSVVPQMHENKGRALAPILFT